MGSSFAALICAAGSSSRMGSGAFRVKKEYCFFDPSFIDNEGKPLTVLGAAVSSFAAFKQIKTIVITVPPRGGWGKEAAKAALPVCLQNDRRIIFAGGSKTRRASVYNALKTLEEYMPQYVLIHDGARPWVSHALISRVMEAAEKSGAVIPAMPGVETPKEIDRPTKAKDPLIRRHLRRAQVVFAQTPQGFAFPEILRAHEKAAANESSGFEYTDDAEVWGQFAGAVTVIDGEKKNRKITFQEDLNNNTAGTVPAPAITMGQRVGLGKDLHRLASGRRFLLGGVEIPFEKGELGHSDGDVLAHALCDALLGAAGLGDIGELFPPSDKKWEGADSMELLRQVWESVKTAGWRILNIDCVISCEKPKVLPYREEIRSSLARALGIEKERLFVKGKTNEGLGDLGAGEAVEALAICLLEMGAP
ncbi:MAG: 2-C-methyl-D-erythritol 2,4-cyclodiphosphate synthase [Treponema sp.]|jgi:2-C-methyl-D-erythritol 4-phosphate cytidylyltransferase/2-C-methyl-D-erythritol 2,4-cyclodiphosphate synthase|nr:2-C-methyl-D-erythritol 2,4-cyclodiphosphate synthase [Treponema sp.]